MLQVLERTIRGYAAAAREELDAIAYNMMSASSAHQVGFASERNVDNK